MYFPLAIPASSNLDLAMPVAWAPPGQAELGTGRWWCVGPGRSVTHPFQGLVSRRCAQHGRLEKTLPLLPHVDPVIDDCGHPRIERCLARGGGGGLASGRSESHHS